MEAPTEARTGARLLAEIEETSLDEILAALRESLERSAAPATAATTAQAPSRRPKSYPLPELDALVAQNFRSTHATPLQLAGRYMPLVYRLVSALVASPNSKAVVIIDVDTRFDATRLVAAEDDIRHVHVYRPARCSPEKLGDVVAAAETWMLYGHHESRTREWWGTIVIGSPLTVHPQSAAAAAAAGGGRGAAARVDVTASWRGWMRVDREELPGFPLGISAREALRDRDKRQDVVDAALWRATCQWGGFSFSEADGAPGTPRCATDGDDEGRRVAGERRP